MDPIIAVVGNRNTRISRSLEFIPYSYFGEKLEGEARGSGARVPTIKKLIRNDSRNNQFQSEELKLSFYNHLQ